MPTVVLMGTLDTKGREYAFVRSALSAAGVTPLLVDFGVLGEPAIQPDIGAAEVARAAGVDLEQLRFGREGSDTRMAALAAMERGLVALVRALHAEGRCQGVLGLAGSGGSGAISAAMRALPLGIPKLLVSTMASNAGVYIGTRDICIMHAVTDIAGLNRVSRAVLRNAANAMAGMVLGERHDDETDSRPLIALTMFGVTTPGVLSLVEGLEASGFETIVFHAVGSGGRSMEEMIEEGLIDGVIDFTPSEVTDHLLGGIFDAGPDRLTAAGRRGIPQVVVPGAAEVLNFGPRASVPQRYEQDGRPIVVHNRNVCAVRINVEESARVGEALAKKINGARGPVAVLLPSHGLDSYAAPPDGPFVDPQADRALFDALRSTLRADIPVSEVKVNANDRAFTDRVLDNFLHVWSISRARSY